MTYINTINFMKKIFFDSFSPMDLKLITTVYAHLFIIFVFVHVIHSIAT